MVGEYELDNEVQALMLQAQVQAGQNHNQNQALQASQVQQIHLVRLEDLYPK